MQFCYLHQQVYIPLYAWASAIYSAQDAQCACVGPRVATARVSGVRELRVCSRGRRLQRGKTRTELAMKCNQNSLLMESVLRAPILL